GFPVERNGGDLRWHLVAGVVVVVGATIAATYFLHSKDRGGGTASPVASYEEIKRRIRSGTSVAVEAMPERHPPRAPKSLDEIFRLSGNEFQSALLERVAIKAARVGHTGLSGSEAVLLDVSSIEGEVFNGGFDQYFFNSSGDRAREALAGLE